MMQDIHYRWQWTKFIIHVITGLFLSQLILTAAGYDATEGYNQTFTQIFLSEQTTKDDTNIDLKEIQEKIEFLKVQLDFIISEADQLKSTLDKAIPIETCKLNVTTPNKPKYNTKQLLNRMLKIQQQILELSKQVSDKTSNIDAIKKRVNSLEKDLEELTKLNDNEGREIEKQFAKFGEHVRNITAEYKQLANQLRNRINDMEDIHNIQLKELINEFSSAMSNKNFDYAALKFSSLADANRAKIVIQRSYNRDNFDCFLKLGEKLDLNKKILLYDTIFDVIIDDGTTLGDICFIMRLIGKLYIIENQTSASSETVQRAKQSIARFKEKIISNIPKIASKNNYLPIQSVIIIYAKDPKDPKRNFKVNVAPEQRRSQILGCFDTYGILSTTLSSKVPYVHCD